MLLRLLLMVKVIMIMTMMMMMILLVDGYPMQDVVMQWRGDSLTEAVHGVEFIEIPQFTLVDYRAISTVESLATGPSLSLLDNNNNNNNNNNDNNNDNNTCQDGRHRMAHHQSLCRECFLRLNKWRFDECTVSQNTRSVPEKQQSFWDRPGILADRALIESSLVELSQRARFLAAQAPHSGDWLLALPIANCGLRLDDEAVRVAVGMWLGLSLCVPHNCHRGTLLDAHGLHAMVCKKAPGKIARHHVLNDIIWRAFGAAGIPSIKEPPGLDRQDGKRPDGLILISRRGGRSLISEIRYKYEQTIRYTLSTTRSHK